MDRVGDPFGSSPRTPCPGPIARMACAVTRFNLLPFSECHFRPVPRLSCDTFRGEGPFPPAPGRHGGPDRLHNPERPGALQEAVDRAERTGRREGENETTGCGPLVCK